MNPIRYRYITEPEKQIAPDPAHTTDIKSSLHII